MKEFTMKNTKTLAKRGALIAVLILGSSSWLSAQQTNQGQYGQPGSGLDGQQNRYGTNSQYNQGRSGQPAGQNRQDNYGAYGTNSQHNQGRTGQSGYGAHGTNSQYNQGRIGQTEGGLGRQQDGYDASDSQSLQVTKINKGSAIIGTTIKNQQGESLGKIRDLVIDLNTGQVAYLVLDSETGLFNAAKLHAVPLRAFQPDAEGTSLILNTDKAQLDSSEGFAKDNWPGAATATWGAEPSWKGTEGTFKSPEAYDADRQHTNDLKDKTYKDSTSEPKRSQPRP